MKIINMMGDEVGNVSDTYSAVFKLPGGEVWFTVISTDEEPLIKVSVQNDKRATVSDGCGNSMVRSNDVGSLFISVADRR